MGAFRVIRVAVLIDWQNTYRQARVAFGLANAPGERGIVSPLGLARVLAAGNKRRRHELVRVEVHRGLADSRRQPTANSAALRQRDAWEAESPVESPRLVRAKLRPLAYDPETGDPEEKGIDVAIAVSALELAITGDADVIVIFSHDSDLVPSIDAIRRLYGHQPTVETGSWWSPTYRKRIPPTRNVMNHTLDEETFLSIETPIDYRPPNRRRSKVPRV